jgi:hypothetical protein
MGTSLVGIHAAWNAGLRGTWDSDTEYAPGDAVLSRDGFSGWLAIEGNCNVEPPSAAWDRVWFSCGVGPVGAQGPRYSPRVGLL